MASNWFFTRSSRSFTDDTAIGPVLALKAQVQGVGVSDVGPVFTVIAQEQVVGVADFHILKMISLTRKFLVFR